MRRALAGVALALVAVGCATPLTSTRVEPSFAETFAGLFESQQIIRGRTDVDRAKMKPTATCRRNGPAQDGPGEDWICKVQYTDITTLVTQQFEVQVKPDGCWKAEGPPTFQLAQIVDARTKKPVTNPLAEFDGCFDTS